MFDYLIAALSPFNIALALFGVVAGTVIGSLPGLTATMAVAVLVPITFTMEPAAALILMGAIYTGAIYGGAYAAILLNTPGTPSAIATTFDGYPLARKGQGDLAITVACISSVCGGMVGAMFLLLLSPPLADVALSFGPVEYFWLAVFGLTLISALAEASLLKGLVGACLGLLLSTVGVAEISADVRYTFGSQTLLGGIETVSALIGLYCVPVLIDLVSTPDKHLRVADEVRGFRLRESLVLAARNKFNLARSSVIGTLVGILPGAGGSIAGLVSYAEAKRAAKNADQFGKGAPQGVMATESANNATVGGGFIPTLVLGIPGTPPDAVILGALLIQGIRTGPNLFTAEGSIVYTFIFGLFLATVLMLPTGLVIGRYAYKTIITVPKALLVPTVAFLTIIGTFSIRNSVSDVIIMIILGVIGWLLNRVGFSPSPIVLGLVLGSIGEQGFVQGWTIGNAAGDLSGTFFARPISVAILLAIAVAVFTPLLRARLRRSAKTAADEAENTRSMPSEKDAQKDSRKDYGGIVGAAALIIVAVVALWDSTNMVDADSYIFPRAVAGAMLVFCLLFVASQFIARGKNHGRAVVDADAIVAPDAAHPSANKRRIALVATMLISALAMPFIGFAPSGIAGFIALVLIAMYEPWTRPRKWFYPLSGCVIVAAFYALFAYVLLVPLPVGALFR